MYRLESTQADVGGWPPVVICFEQSYDREAVLSKAYCLEKNGILVRKDICHSWTNNTRTFVAQMYPPRQIMVKRYFVSDNRGHVMPGAPAVVPAKEVHGESEVKISDSSVLSEVF